MELIIELFNQIDWKVAFTGLALLISLISLKLSIESTKRDKEHKQAEQQLRESQLLVTIDNKLYQAWDLMGGDIESQLVKKFASRANLNQAKRLIDECLQLKSDYAPVYRHLGIYYLGLWEQKSENYQHKSKTAFLEAIRLDPEDSIAHYNLGIVLRDMKRFDEAEKAYQEAIRLNPEHVYAHNALGVVLYKTERFEEAEAAFREAIRLDLECSYAHNNLGVIFWNSKRFDESEKAYREAIRLDPENVDAYNGLGNVLYDTKSFDDAEAAYREAIRLDSEFAMAHNNLGNVLSDTKRFDDAEAAYREAISLDSGFAMAHNNLEILLKERKSALNN